MMECTRFSTLSEITDLTEDKTGTKGREQPMILFRVRTVTFLGYQRKSRCRRRKTNRLRETLLQCYKFRDRETVST